MNTKTAQQIAIAFKRGLAFIRGIKRMAQDGWITIGALEEEKDEKGNIIRPGIKGRKVYINDETGLIEKGLSRESQGKTLKEAISDLKEKRETEKGIKAPEKEPQKAGGKKEPEKGTPEWRQRIRDKYQAKFEAEQAEKAKEEQRLRGLDIFDRHMEEMIKRETGNKNYAWSAPTTEEDIRKRYATPSKEFTDFKNKVSKAFNKLDPNDPVVEEVKQKLLSVLPRSAEGISKFGQPSGFGHIAHAEQKLLEQGDEIERYSKGPEEYKKASQKILDSSNKVIEDLSIRRRALAKLPNDRGTNAYITKLANAESELRNMQQKGIKPIVETEIWRKDNVSLTDAEKIQENARKIIASVDKNAKYKDVLANAKKGEFYQNITTATAEQAERGKEYDERRQGRVDRMKARAEGIKAAGYERASKGWEQLHEIPFGQPNIVGRPDIYKTPTRNIEGGYAEVSRGEQLERRAEGAERKLSDIRSDDPMLIQKLQEKIENTVSSAERRRLNERLRQAIKNQERAQSGEGLKASNKLYDLDEDFTDGRVRFKFDGKPDAEVISVMKSNGFKWSPKNKAWQRQNTPNGLWAARRAQKELERFVTGDEMPEELIRYSTRWVTIGRGARIMVDSNGTIRAGLGGKYNGRQFADVFKSREITGEKAALEKPEEQIEEMTEEQHAGEVNGAGVLDKLINGVSVWP